MASSVHPGFRIYILGAGFSKPAGLPLATELYPLVRESIVYRHGNDTKFSRDVSNYLEYCESCGVAGQTEQILDLEQLMSYLDIEHYLGFRGSDTWSQEGNESQLMIRRAIGEVIDARTPEADKLPDIYYRFAESLSTRDTVLTLNYDLVLERALAKVGKPFRRFPHRYQSVDQHGGILDSDTEEVVLLKLHGSVDWFDNRQFLELESMFERQGTPQIPRHSVFADPARYGVQPLAEGLQPPGDSLRHIFWMRETSKYYERDGGFNAPFLLSPSHVKFVYADPILSFWRGIGRSGGYNLGVSVIGFSLPPHDEYIRIGLYQMLSNYGSWWNETMFDGTLKDYARFVDYRTNDDQIAEYRSRYRFADSEKSRFCYGGFGHDALEFLFRQRREA